MRGWARRWRAGARTAALLAGSLLASGAAVAGPPFRTDDPIPVDYQHWEIYGFSTATGIRGDTSGTLPGLEVNYGAVPNVQLHMIVPLAFDQSAGGGWQEGYGDTELGVKYRFLQEDTQGWLPMAAIFPAVDLPTGDAERGLGTGHTHAFLPLWLQKSFGPWSSDAGLGYWINPGGDNKNYWFFGWELQRQVTKRLALGGEIFHQTADIEGGEDSTGFNLGFIYDFSAHHHLLVSAGSGIENAGATDDFSYYLAYQLTF